MTHDEIIEVICIAQNYYELMVLARERGDFVKSAEQYLQAVGQIAKIKPLTETYRKQIVKDYEKMIVAEMEAKNA